MGNKMGFKRVVFIFKKYIYSTLLWTPPPLFPPFRYITMDIQH